MSRQHDPERCLEGHPRTVGAVTIDERGHVRCLICRRRRYRNQHLPSVQPEITPELKAQAIELRSAGLTFREIGDRLGCSHSAAHKWCSR